MINFIFEDNPKTFKEHSSPQQYKMRLLSLLLCFTTLVGSLNAQDESVKKEIDTLLAKFPEYQRAETASLEITKALRQSEQNGFYKYGQLNYWMGESLLTQSHYDSAGAFYQQAITHLKKTKEESLLGRAYIGEGFVYNFRTLYNDALTSDLKAEKIFRRLGEKKMLARSLKRIGDDIFFGNNAKAPDAEAYYAESITISEAEKDTLNIIRGLNGISSVYTETRQYTKSEAVLNRAILLGEKTNCLRCLAISYSQFGINEHKRGRFENAIKAYKQEYNINKKLGIGYDQFFVYQNIAEALVELGRFDEALVYSDSSMRIAEADVSLTHIHDAYKVRYKALKGKGDTKQALYAFEKQMQFRDSIFSEEKDKIMSQMRTEYNLERKELQIADLENKNRINELEATSARQTQIGLIVFLALMVLLVGVLYNRYQLKQRTAKALDDKNQELQQLNSFKDKMFAVISHDLRNPVDAFSMLMESLSQNIAHASQEEMKEFLESMLASARDLKGLLNNLLEWSLVQIGKLPFNPKAFSIADASETSEGHVHGMAREANIAIHISPSKIQALADKNMVVIIVRNLLTNAIKFSGQGKRIDITTLVKDGMVVTAVKDEGVGMSPEELKNLFNTATSTETKNKQGKGAGIGLLLCKELAEKNSGHIYAESEEGKGSTFYLALPLA